MFHRISSQVFFVILCSFVLLVHESATQWIPTCCPLVGYELATDIFEEKAFRTGLNCVSISNESLAHEQFYGLKQNTSSEESHLPHCPEDKTQVLFQLADMDKVEISEYLSCVDVLNSTNQVVTCKDNNNKPYSDLIEVYPIRKCCRDGFIYDTEEKACSPISDSFQHVTEIPFWTEESKDVQLFKFLLNQFKTDAIEIGNPLITLGVPKCTSDEALVNYYLKTGEFTLQHNRIIPNEGLNNRALDIFLTQPNDTFCVESVAQKEASELENLTWLVRVCRPKSICDSMPCIRKCCNHNEKLTMQKNCEVFERDLNMTFHEILGDDEPKLKHIAEYGTLYGQSCEMYFLYPGEAHYFDEKTGHLHSGGSVFQADQYCVEHIDMGAGYEERITFPCFLEKINGHEYKIYAIGLCVSCVFLFATLLVYASLPKLLNLHGKTLVSHVSSLLIAYAGLAYIQFGIGVRPQFCYSVALFTYGSFLAAFSWLNVMCFDIWWTFGSVRQSRGMRKTRDTKRFIGYSLYAWGIPVILTTFLHLVEQFKFLDQKYLPNMGHNKCWFAETYGLSRLLFFLLPCGIIFTTNIILFVMTAVHCNRVKSEIYKMQMNDAKDSAFHKKRFFADKARLLMNLKLFCVMGISWVLELLSSFWDEPATLFLVTDIINTMQGFFVFLIFVFKRNVLTSIKKRLGIATRASRGATTQMGGTTNTGTTTTSLMSSQQQICADPYKMTKSTSQLTVNGLYQRQKSSPN